MRKHLRHAKATLNFKLAVMSAARSGDSLSAVDIGQLSDAESSSLSDVSSVPDVSSVSDALVADP